MTRPGLCGCVLVLTLAAAVAPACGRSDDAAAATPETVETAETPATPAPAAAEMEERGTLSAAAAAAAAAESPATHLEFVDVAAQAGIDVVNVCGDPRRWYIPESNGNGAAWLDYDDDGDMDLFVGNGAALEYLDDGARLEVVSEASSRLYRNEGAWRFTDVTDEAGARRSDWVNAIAVADIENDGDSDLYLACFGADVLLRNEGGRFVDATAEVGLGCELWGAGAALGDADNDGDLDLYVANYVHFDPAAPPDEGRRVVIEGVEVGIGPEAENKRGINTGAPDVFYRNEGGRFVDATAEAGLALPKGLCSYAVVFSDVDADGWQDILVANDLQPCNLFHNKGDGSFEEQGVARGFAFDGAGKPTSAMGLVVEDVDEDGDMDVLRTNFDLEVNNLHVNDGKGHFTEVAARVGLADPSFDKLGWGAAFLDAECDGDLDLLVANGHVYPQAKEIGMSGWLMPTQLYEAWPIMGVPLGPGNRMPRWHDVTSAAGSGLAPLKSARGLAIADVDDDGDSDAIVIDMDGPPRLLENRSVRHGHWISVRPLGTVSNRDGIGARISVTTGPPVVRTWTREMRTTQGLYSSHDPRLHFGLGPALKIAKVEIAWPSGRKSVVEAPEMDQMLVVREP